MKTEISDTFLRQTFYHLMDRGYVQSASVIMKNVYQTDRVEKIPQEQRAAFIRFCLEYPNSTQFPVSGNVVPFGMTQTQKSLHKYLGEYIATYGVSPSYDEMKHALGLKSKSGIHRLINGLEERGLIARLPNRARSIVVLRAAA